MYENDQFQVIEPDDLMSIPVGSVIYTGRRRPEASTRWKDSEKPGIWLVFSYGKALLVNERFPNAETEDLDWFKPWEVRILGHMEPPA